MERPLKLLTNSFIILQTGYQTVRWGRFRLNSPYLSQNGIEPSLFVYSLIAFWAELNEIPFHLIRQSGSFELVEILYQFIRRLDDWIDSPDGALIFSEEPASWESHKSSQEMVRAFFHNLGMKNLSAQKSEAIVFDVRDFIQRAIAASLLGSQLQLMKNQTIETLMPILEETSGLVSATIARILNHVHDIREEQGEKIAMILSDWTVAVQVVDDLIDLESDYRDNNLNIVATCLRNYPLEYQKYIAEKGKFGMDHGVWIRRHAPKTYQELGDVCESYLAKALSHAPNNEVARRLYRMGKAYFFVATTSHFFLKFGGRVVSRGTSAWLGN